MKMSKKIMIGSVVMLFLLAIGGFALVSGAAGQGSGYAGCSRFAFGPHRAFSGPDVSDFMLWRLDRLAAELDLSADQKQKFDLWKHDLKTHIAEGAAARRQFLDHLHVGLNQPDPDVAMLIEAAQTRIMEMSTIAIRNLDLFTEVWQTLNNQQRKTIVDHVRRAADNHPMP